MTSDVVLVPTGTANIASVLAAFRRLGTDPVIARDPDTVDRADRVVLPGVGSFGAAMGELDRRGMRAILSRRLEDGRATLAICVGMQLLATMSEESDDIRGLGVVEVPVTRFPGTVRIPQIGWNEVIPGADCRFITDGWAYFANSYRVERIPSGWSVAVGDHGGEFVAAIERGAVLACQFHPELSGTWGESVLGRWLESTERGT